MGNCSSGRQFSGIQAQEAWVDKRMKMYTTILDYDGRPRSMRCIRSKLRQIYYHGSQALYSPDYVVGAKDIPFFQEAAKSRV